MTTKYTWAKNPNNLHAAGLAPYRLANVPSLPVKVDLRNMMPPIVDQGNLGDCTGNAIASAVEYADIKEGRATVNNPTIVSRLFIYYQERVIEGDVGQDNGAYIHDGIRALYTYGAPLESLWPYNINKFAVRPSAAAYTDALNRKLTTNAANTPFTVSSVASSGNWITVNSTSGMGVNGAITLTGSLANLTTGTYYIKSIGVGSNQNKITVSTTYGGTTFVVNATRNGAMTGQLIPGYQSVPTGSVSAVQNCLASGYPVVIGFNVYDSFESGAWWQPGNTGRMPYPNVNREQLLGGHCVLIVGYDNTPGSPTQNYFICRNSWGTGWGVNGYFYMPYQVIQNANMSNDFWIVCTTN